MTQYINFYQLKEGSSTAPVSKTGRVMVRDAWRLKPGQWINSQILVELGEVLQAHVQPDRVRVLPPLFYQHLNVGTEINAAHWMRHSLSFVSTIALHRDS
jgi:hypothetical protein